MENTILDEALEIFGEAVDPKITNIIRTLVIVKKRDENGNLVLAKQVVRERIYLSSGHWGKLPNGEYSLYMSQGGIRNRYVPREEKDRLVYFLLYHHDDIKSFTGVVKIENNNGVIRKFQIEPK